VRRRVLDDFLQLPNPILETQSKAELSGIKTTLIPQLYGDANYGRCAMVHGSRVSAEESWVDGFE